MTYCFRCRVCGATFELSSRLVPGCYHCGAELQRDYRAENAAPQVLQLKREREAGGRSAVRDLFLPKAEDFKSPEDPDGYKGVRQWNDEHEPRAGNKRPLRPEGKREVF